MNFLNHFLSLNVVHVYTTLMDDSHPPCPLPPFTVVNTLPLCGNIRPPPPMEVRSIVKRHFYVRDKFMQILSKGAFMRFIFMSSSIHCNAWCNKDLCALNLCDLHLTRIIHIK